MKTLEKVFFVIAGVLLPAFLTLVIAVSVMATVGMIGMTMGVDFREAAINPLSVSLGLSVATFVLIDTWE